MITLNLERQRDGQRLSRYTRHETPAEALSFLVQSEFAFGARIIELSEVRMHLETGICDMVDVTYVEGTADEMRTLVETAAFYLLACEQEDIVNTGAAIEYGRLIERNAMNSGHIINIGAPMFVGRSRVRVAVMLALGYRDENDLRLAASVSLADLMTLIGMLPDFPEMNLQQLAENLGYNMTAAAA